MDKIVCPFCQAPIKHTLKPMDRRGLAACDACMNPFVYRIDGAKVAIEAPKHVQDIRQMAPPESSRLRK